MSHPVSTHDVEDPCHVEDDAASPVVDPVSEQDMIDEELRGKAERRRKFHGPRVISPRLPMGRHALNYDTLLPSPGRRNREIDDGGLDW
mgnify:FL=1